MGPVTKLSAMAAAVLLCLTAMASAQSVEDAVAASSRGDYTTALSVLRSLAEQGNTEAQSILGAYYANGLGVSQDYAEAMRWYRKAAEQGNTMAQVDLGNGYASGSGVPKNFTEAYKWYRRAAEQGIAAAQFNLGILLAWDQGTPQEHIEAVSWFRKAASQGLAHAQYSLGQMYAIGRGVPQDFAETVKWYRKAAEQGLVEAQGSLGAMYALGKGTTQDYAESVKWYRKAAEQGFVDAQLSLGQMYAFGGAIPQDFVLAHMWFNLAAANGNQEAVKNRDHTAKFMNPAQLTEAQKLAREWKPKTLSGPWEKFAQAGAANPFDQFDPPKVAAPPKAHAGAAPTLSVKPVATTPSSTIDVAGNVSSKGRITSLQIDGTDVPLQSGGGFSVRRGIPLGESVIRLVATDEWGQSAEATVKVTRITASTETTLARLSPGHLNGKSRPNAIALIIGIEHYKSAPPAEFAENDARRFYDYATSALGVPASRVKLLTGADAQRVDVEAAILTWLKPQVVRGQTEVFLFFSGHGLASDDGKDLYLLPQDGNRALLDRSALRRKELIDMIVDSGAKSATLFLDTCYSGGTRGKETLVSSARPILVAAKEQTVPANVTILAAAGNDQLSSSLTQAKHGLFSYFLMKGLEGDAAGPDRTITAAKLEAYLAEKIPAEAAKLGRTQTPQLIGDGNRVVSSW
ncbi:caspase family protein [Paramagnetospirillum caucaseum]|uniref:caspase family protein n=1 Tax=Paramagnetospirillum caucaseum TaxID=1244869 RepID=UPI0013779FBB|nr:caspase family protein [Paramagnetospirillum caucaseum]